MKNAALITTKADRGVLLGTVSAARIIPHVIPVSTKTITFFVMTFSIFAKAKVKGKRTLTFNKLLQLNS